MLITCFASFPLHLEVKIGALCTIISLSLFSSSNDSTPNSPSDSSPSTLSILSSKCSSISSDNKRSRFSKLINDVETQLQELMSKEDFNLVKDHR